MKAIHAQLIRIGNSKGVRIPKALLDATGLSGDLEIEAHKDRLVIRKKKHPREGWEEEARRMHDAGDDKLLDPPVPTAFDKNEWEW